MIVLVCGGRAYDDREFVYETLDFLHAQNPIELLVHGACKLRGPAEPPFDGADGLADDWAIARGVPYDRNPADWRKLGRRAGPIRNAAMLKKVIRLAGEWPKPTVILVVAFPGGTGTARMLELARDARITSLEVEGRGKPWTFGPWV